ncbi:hypothetical protein TELCIR_03271 [Teladorsagia circumcincta]|uniref:Uncharacterized protein n=1 Tax=Teladorsagia circumcincta TaxID=45464 RepID=A0A2G9UWT9_TELCI|nr:hypothetical protein TELCIR_03271 [Teladorsagia circumcincta]
MKLIKSKFPRDTQLEVNRLEHRSGKKWTLPDLLDGLNEVIEEFEKLDDYSIDHLRQNPNTIPTSVASVVPLTTSPYVVIIVCLLRIAVSSPRPLIYVGNASTKDTLATIVDIPSVVAAPVTITLFSAINKILVRRLDRDILVIATVHHHRILRVATVSLEVRLTNVPDTHHVRRLDTIPTVALHHHREDQIGQEDLTDHVVWTVMYVFDPLSATVLRLLAVIGQERLPIPKDTQHRSIRSSIPKTIPSPSISPCTVSYPS